VCSALWITGWILRDEEHCKDIIYKPLVGLQKTRNRNCGYAISSSLGTTRKQSQRDTTAT
jgi:hypothetical protein